MCMWIDNVRGSGWKQVYMTLGEDPGSRLRVTVWRSLEDGVGCLRRVREMKISRPGLGVWGVLLGARRSLVGRWGGRRRVVVKGGWRRGCGVCVYVCFSDNQRPSLGHRLFSLTSLKRHHWWVTLHHIDGSKDIFLFALEGKCLSICIQPWFEEK